MMMITVTVMTRVIINIININITITITTIIYNMIEASGASTITVLRASGVTRGSALHALSSLGAVLRGDQSPATDEVPSTYWQPDTPVYIPRYGTDWSIVFIDE